MGGGTFSAAQVNTAGRALEPTTCQGLFDNNTEIELQLCAHDVIQERYGSRSQNEVQPDGRSSLCKHAV